MSRAYSPVEYERDQNEPSQDRRSWADGRVLDFHSTGSEFPGHDEFGREQFDTHRTEVGELLYA